MGGKLARRRFSEGQRTLSRCAATFMNDRAERTTDTGRTFPESWQRQSGRVKPWREVRESLCKTLILVPWYRIAGARLRLLNIVHLLIFHARAVLKN